MQKKSQVSLNFGFTLPKKANYAFLVLLNFILIFYTHLFLVYVFLCECIWSSGDSLCGSVLFFYHMGPRAKLRLSGLVTNTFIHRRHFCQSSQNFI